MLLSPSSCLQVPKFLIKEAKLSLRLILECFQFIHIDGGETTISAFSGKNYCKMQYKVS